MAVRASYVRTRFNRAFRSVFRFVSDNISDNFCIVCTQTAFFIEKQKALGDFQIFFQIIFASFVSGLKAVQQQQQSLWPKKQLLY